MRNKARYAIDNRNRLIIKQKQKKIIADGKISIDKNNSLIYWLNEPAAWRRQYSLPSRIIFTGNWQLNKNHDLELNLSQAKGRYKNGCLVLKGDIISTDADTLVFEIVSQDKHGLLNIQLLKLTGSWKADEYNRIAFLVGEKTTPDVLTFKGSWQINQNQQINYTYEKTNLLTKTKSSQALTFEGSWQITGASRLRYILTKSSRSCFDFRVQVETPNLYPRQGVIKYRLGIGLRREKSFRMKIISLYGTWKFSRRLGLIFQMDYGRGAVHAIKFGSELYLNKKDNVVFYLTSERKEPLGISVTFTHRFLRQNNGEAFLRIKCFEKEKGVETGLSIPF